MGAGMVGPTRAACSRRSTQRWLSPAGWATGRIGALCPWISEAMRGPFRRPPRSPERHSGKRARCPGDAPGPVRVAGRDARAHDGPRRGWARLVPGSQVRWGGRPRARFSASSAALPRWLWHRSRGALASVTAWGAARAWGALGPETAVTRSGCPGPKAGAWGPARSCAPAASHPGAAALVEWLPRQVRGARAGALEAGPLT